MYMYSVCMLKARTCMYEYKTNKVDEIWIMIVNMQKGVSEKRREKKERAEEPCFWQ